MTIVCQRVLSIVPGFAVCALIGLAAYIIGSKTGFPVMIIAIIAGLFVHRLYRTPALKPGVDWTAKPLLNIAVALLGLRIEMAVIAQHGIVFPLLALFILSATILLGYVIGRLFKIDKAFSVLMAGAIAVCGVSAAAAIASVLPDDKNKSNHLALTIGGVTVLSTLAMILYPFAAQGMGFSPAESGVIMGASIHNVSQAVGAGYAVSDAAGNLATIVKLLRVSLLLPVVLVISVIFASRTRDAKRSWRTYMPPFLIAFFVLAFLNYLGVVPPALTNAGSTLAEWLLIISMVAIGVKTNMADIIKVGPKPLIAMTVTTLLMAGLAIAAVLLIKV